MNKFIAIIFLLILFGCSTENERAKLKFLIEEIPHDTPLEFKSEIIPDNKIIHKGIFSPDLEEYYYTISDKNFENFEVLKIYKNKGAWSEPEKAFFNSKYDEHGMSFSPDGNTIYFSSTRPVNIVGIHSTWHIWKSDKINGQWGHPVFVDIPNLKDKLVSHPTITNSGTLYFHSSNLDYSEMSIYKSKRINDKFSEAQKVSISMKTETGSCTPFVSPEEDYLIFAAIGSQLDLMISYKNGNGHWSNPKRLNDRINSDGQGNPYVTPDNKFLFYTIGDDKEKNWKVKWVRLETEIENN